MKKNNLPDILKPFEGTPGSSSTYVGNKIFLYLNWNVLRYFDVFICEFKTNTIMILKDFKAFICELVTQIFEKYYCKCETKH